MYDASTCVVRSYVSCRTSSDFFRKLPAFARNNPLEPETCTFRSATKMSWPASAITAMLQQELVNKRVDYCMYERFFDALRRSFTFTCGFYVFGENLGPMYARRNPDGFLTILAISRQLAPLREDWGGERIRTWADFANILRNAMATHNLVAYNNQDAHRKILEFSLGFARIMRYGVSAKSQVDGYLDFLIKYTAVDVAEGYPAVDVAEGYRIVDVAEGQPAAVASEQEEEDIAETESAADDDGDADEPAAADDDGDADEPAAADDDGDADEPAAADDDGDADEPAAADDDGDVVMETEKAVSEGRGSKRCRSLDWYDKEMSRAAEVKRRYNLRGTRAREKWMTTLKEAEDSKRKADEVESSPKVSRKKSRR